MSTGEVGQSVLVLEAEAKAAVPIIESCAKGKLFVVAGSSRKYCCGFFTHGTRRRIVYPSPHTKPQECIDFLLDFLQKHHISVLFPVGDVMTYLVAKRQDEFRKFTGLVLPPYNVFIQGRDKILTLKAAVRAGCPIPVTWYPQEQSVEKIAEQASYPVLIKPAIGVGARGITFCGNPKELLEKFSQVEAQFGKSFVQELVPQAGTQYKVDAIVDDSRRLLAGVVYTKLRYYPASGGSSVLNKTEYRPDILELAVKVLKEINWAGFCDFDFITDPRDGVVKLMEINPRYPESYRATVAAGVDMTKIIYQLAGGQKPTPHLEYEQNKYTRFLFGDIMWFLTTKENRWRTKPGFFNFFSSDTNYQLVRARDWGPIIGYLLENVSMLWNKEQREFRLRFADVWRRP